MRAVFFVKSFVFSASTMYDDEKRLASWKFQKKASMYVLRYV